MSNNQQLEVLLSASRVHEPSERLSQSLRVGLIEVGGRLVKRQDAACDAKALRKRQSDDEARQHALSR